MAIIFVDIKELENSEMTNIIPTGNNDEEKAMQVVEYFEKGNDVILKGTIITEYEKMIEEIKNQFDYSDMSDYQYWHAKSIKDKMVIMLNYDMTLSFDYFLFRENKIGEYYKYTADTKDFNIIYRTDVPEKLIKRDMIRDIVVLESEDNKDISYESEENRIKKMLFTDRAGVAKKIEKYFGIEEKKVPKESIHDYYKLVFLFYYLDKHGIPSEDGVYKRIKVLDNIMKPRIQMVPNYIEHTNVATSAVENDLLKNEIVKHLSLSQIKRANRIYVQLLHCYNTVFQYIGKLLDIPIDMMLEERELSNIEERVARCQSALEHVEQMEKNSQYKDSVWEIAYHRYKGFMLRCEREDSYNSLKYALELGQPSSPMFFDVVPHKYMYANILQDKIAAFVKENAEWFAEIISEGCTKRWVQDHCKDVEKACWLMQKFYRRVEFDSFPFTMVVSAAQAVHEVQKKKLKYENSYKGYKGNKRISLYATLSNIDEKGGEVTAFEYAWTAIIKRWCNYNEKKYNLWEHSVKIDLKFTDLMRGVTKLDSIDDIDILVEGLFAETSVPEKSRMTGIKQVVEEEIYQLGTGYRLVIEDMRVIREFEHENVKKYFVHVMNDVIRFNNSHYDENKFVFHLNMQYMALKFIQDKVNKIICLVDMRHLRLGNQYKMFHRALELELPWFTEDFREF